MLFRFCIRRKKERDDTENRDRVNALGRVSLRESITHALFALCSHSFFSTEEEREQPSSFVSRCLLALLELNYRLASKLTFSSRSWYGFFSPLELNSCFPNFLHLAFSNFSPFCLFVCFFFNKSVLRFSYQISQFPVTGTNSWCICRGSAR